MRAFGNPTLADEQTQETWGWTWLERLLQDLRFATRQIRRAPGFALIAILTLALGIGANNAVFTLTHALLLQGLPIPEPDRLVRLSTHLPSPSGEYMDLGLSLPMIQTLQQRAHTIRGAFAWCVYDFPLTEKNGVHGIHGAVVSGNAFQTLAVRPALGRLLTPADDQPGGGPDGWAAVISYREWMEYFHGDPSVLGRHMIVTDHSVTVVGVAPQGFEGVIVAEHPDIYLPLEFTAALYGEPSLHNGGRLWLTAFAGLNRVSAYRRRPPSCPRSSPPFSMCSCRPSSGMRPWWKKHSFASVLPVPAGATCEPVHSSRLCSCRCWSAQCC